MQGQRSGLQGGSTRSGLGGGTTRGLAGGVSRIHSTTKTKNRAGTTTGSNQFTEKEFIQDLVGNKWEATPKPLIEVASGAQGSGVGPSGIGQSITSTTTDRRSQAIQDQSITQSSDRKSMSISKSHMDESGVSESEDEIGDSSKQDKPVEDKYEGLKPKQDENILTASDLEKMVDIELTETDTVTFLHIPSVAVSIVDNKELHAEETKKNAAYNELLSKKIGSDSYTNRPAQCYRWATKSKDIWTTTVSKKDTGDNATEWDIEDRNKIKKLPLHEEIQAEILDTVERQLTEKLREKNTLLDVETGKPLAIARKPRDAKDSKDTSSLSNSRMQSSQSGVRNESSRSGLSDKDSKMSDTTKGEHGRGARQKAKAVSDANKVAENNDTDPLPESLNTQLKYVERILNQNEYLREHIEYKNYPVADILSTSSKKAKEEPQAGQNANLKRKFGRAAGQADEEKEAEKAKELEMHQADLDKTPDLKYLFSFECEYSKGRNITCCDWNKKNPDLLAVAYGEYEFMSGKEGLLMFWTLKNPTFPERIIRAPSSITSCQFSKTNPNLIACGFYDGVVAIYDVRKQDDKPIADSREMIDKHIDTVWETRWVNHGDEKGEALISISADGRVVEWNIKKGLEKTDLMRMKRQANPNQKQDEKEGIIFRQASGFSFDFPRGDNTSVYFAATEDGTIHQCSRAYQETYLDTYFGHSGPVYKVRCNPYWENIFLSCSADWTVKLWNYKEENPVYTFQSLDLTDQVNDIEWSRTTSTVFGSVTDDGRIEIWDLAHSPLDPLIVKKRDNEGNQAPRTTIRFAPHCPVVITGDTNGVIDVFRIKNMEHEEITDDDQKARLEEAILQKSSSSSVKTNVNEHVQEQNSPGSLRPEIKLVPTPDP